MDYKNCNIFLTSSLDLKVEIYFRTLSINTKTFDKFIYDSAC